MRAFVRLRTGDGQTTALGPGDIIGRLATAALQLDDARISEAHAMVSLRGRELKLLALRGLFAIGGSPLDEVVLQAGQSIEIARGVHLCVEEVVLPESLLAVEGDGLPRQILSSTTSILVAPRPALVPRYQGDAAAHIWDNGLSWRIRSGDGPARDLRPGDSWQLAGQRFRALEVALDRAGQLPTQLDGAIHPRLHIVAAFETVHIHADGRPVLVLDGIAARIVSELVALGGPAPWELVAAQIWPAGSDPESAEQPDLLDRTQLRRRWDISLARLRRKLRDARVRPDLVRACGTGQVELLLCSGDTVEDHV
ncbi:MAG: FHA domain-containing protein [Polyangia bacterium]